VCLIFFKKEINNVNIPTLPINIVNINIILLISLNELVIPKLKPTVLNAEKHSKTIDIIFLSLSKIVIKNTEKPITIKDNEITEKALFIEISAISLWKISVLFLRLAILKIFKVAIAKVLVFIPPPVEAGEAPTHIKNIINNMVEACNEDISIVLNPAVLGVTTPKKAPTILPKTD
jgi:hypothetical protein